MAARERLFAGAVTGCALVLVAAAWVARPVDPALWPQLLFLGVLAQGVTLATYRRPGLPVKMALGVPLVAAGLLSPGAGVATLALVATFDHRLPVPRGEGWRALFDRSSLAMTHLAASLVAATVAVPQPYTLVTRTAVYGVLVFVMLHAWTAAAHAAEGRPALDEVRALRDLVVVRADLLLCFGGGVVFALLGTPGGWLMCLVLVAFLLSMRAQMHHAQRVSALAEEARHDALTGLLNRRGFRERTERVLGRGDRDLRVAVVAMDIDHFKSVNDTFGHASGDRVLVAVAGVMRDVLRATDIAGRVGGEEFVIVVPDSGPERGFRVAERVRAAVAGLDLLPGRRVTLSAGVTAGGRDDLEQLLKIADEALYAAKRGGRDRTVIGAPKMHSNRRRAAQPVEAEAG